jgi:DNA polymerase-1
MTLTAWDIECTITQHMKRKASPFTRKNWVVTHAFEGATGGCIEHRFGKQPPGPGWLRPVLAGTRLLCGFNIKFDLLHALQDPDNLEAWMEYVVSGGMIWDCQLAEYLLEGMDQKNQMLSLDEVSPRYGGTLKVDEVKELWAAGVNTHEIEPALLTRYLCGDGTVEGDVSNTRKIAIAQVKRAREAKQLMSIMLNMGSLIATTEMERNGMFVDMPLALKHAEEMRIALEELRVSLQQFLPVDLPFQFNWTNRYHLSPMIFGGRIKYERRAWALKDGTETWTPPEAGNPTYAYTQKDETHYVLDNGSTCECLWWDHCMATEWQYEAPEGKDRAYFMSGKNAGEPKTKRVKVDDRSKPKSAMRECFYEFPGVTGPNKEWASSTPGLYSVASDVIEELGVRDIPFLKALSMTQSLHKDLSTYYIVTDADGDSKGMLALVDEDGIIHHKLNHTSTVTGRFSSSDPNLQNVPKGSKSKVKLVFVSRFPDGKIIQSDFSSLEVYVQAILTGCRQLIADLRAGLDMHVKRLAVKEGISYDECYALCKGEKYSKEWDYKRTGAKVFSFQRAYGAGAAKISASTGMPLADVEALIAAEDLEYPEIREYFESLTKEIAKNRRPAGVAIPHPEVPGIMCNLGVSYSRTPDGKLYAYREQPAPAFLAKRGTACSFSPTEIKNYSVQGTGGEWMKAAMLVAVIEFYRVRNFGGRALLVNTVHDAMYVDGAPEVAMQAAALLHACMEFSSEYIEAKFDWHIPVPVPSDTSWGASMMDEDKIPGLTELAATLLSGLRAHHTGGKIPSFKKATQ